jgi:hypothetical protein
MAWTTPRTWVAGELVTSTIMNTHVRDNLNAIVAGQRALDGLSFTDVTITTTGTVNDWAPGTGVNVRCNNASALVINGIVPQFDGEIRILEAINSTVQVVNQAGGSSAANRIITASSYGQIVSLGGRIGLKYDGTTDRWRVFFVDPGAPIQYTPTATSAGGTFTLTSTNNCFYQQHGRGTSRDQRLSGWRSRCRCRPDR